MKLLKNRKIAIVITVIVVLLATLFGVGRSLNRLAANTERMFYDGVYLEGQGFTQPAINTHLENIAQAALDCASVFANHSDLYNQSEALRIARREFLDADGISEKFAAYVGLYDAFTAFFSAVETAGLSDRDREIAAQFSSTFSGAVTAISNSEYNDRARNFMDGVSGFAQLLRPFAFVTPPQVFDWSRL